MSSDFLTLESYQIRGVKEPVHRARISGRTVDFWAPKGSKHLIVAHDGQNIFDRRTSTRAVTWRLAQQASELFGEYGQRPPTIIAVFHSRGDSEPNGRAFDLTPEKFFREGLPVLSEVPQGVSLDRLRSDSYLDQIYEVILPKILDRIGVKFDFVNRAMLGSSMGGLATLYELGRKPDRYSTALAYSPHWVLGGDDLVKRMIEALPKPVSHRIWMSRGTRKLDSDYEPYQNLADRLMLEAGWNLERFRSVVYKRAGHSERAWSKQVTDGLRFWLGSERS